MKQLSKLWLDLLFCVILILLTGNTSNSLPKSYLFLSQDSLPNELNLSETSY